MPGIRAQQLGRVRVGRRVENVWSNGMLWYSAAGDPIDVASLFRRYRALAAQPLADHLRRNVEGFSQCLLATEVFNSGFDAHAHTKAMLYLKVKHRLVATESAMARSSSDA